jgi:hyperosmotically inducible periplasmic protein
MKRLSLFCFIVFMSLQVGCNKSQDVTTQAAREPQPRMSNSDLKNQVEARINSDAQLKEADLSIEADVNRNHVTLSGTVESPALRDRAVELARSANPAITVENKIEVKERELTRSEYTEEHARQERENAKQNKETIGDSLDDAWIHSKIVAKLIADSDVPERKINVDVKNSVVTLRGTVDSALQKSETERIAKDTEGVKRVINQLKVQAKAS